ncbi:MAG: ATP-binding protein [Pseudorhodobacter sp.]|nr:ATP-binding protein [Pseudorhodobacter sp.]
MPADPPDGGPTTENSRKAGPSCARIVISADPTAVREGLRALFDTLLLRGLSMAKRGTVEIVLAEALNNIVEHAYADAGGKIELTLQLHHAELVCQIEDKGRPMPGGSLPAGELHVIEGQESPPEGGFGWHLIRTLSRDLHYRRIDGRNQLSFRLDAGQSSL